MTPSLLRFRVTPERGEAARGAHGSPVVASLTALWLLSDSVPEFASDFASDFAADVASFFASVPIQPRTCVIRGGAFLQIRSSSSSDNESQERIEEHRSPLRLIALA